MSYFRLRVLGGLDQRRPRWPLSFAVALLFLFALPSAAGTPAQRITRTGAPIENVAMDGPRAAYSINPGSPGIKILAWNVLSGRKTLVSGSRTRQGSAIWGLAIAGRRVAWIANSSGAWEHDDTLFTSSVVAPKERVRAIAQRYLHYDPPKTPWLEGAWMQGLAGAGDVLAVSRWSTGAGGATLPNGELDLITAGGLRRIVAGTGGIVAQAADSGRIAVLRPSGTIEEPLTYKPSEVAIYTTAGKLLRTIRPIGITLVKPGKMPIGLSGDHLAVLTGKPRLELYNWRTSTLLHSWRVPRGANHVDLWGQIATYLANRGSTGLTLHAVALRTGKDVVLAHAKSPPATSGFVGVEIEGPGLVYAVNEYTSQLGAYGRLVFVPMDRVLAAASKGHVR